MRTPRIAGTWYPDSAEAILKIIAPAAAPEKPSRPAAIIVPHAGYVYSGAVAARAFASLDPGGYDRVIILAPSHCAAMRRSFSVEPAAEVATPFGAVALSPKLHDALAALPGARFVPEAHPREHAVDIQLPLVKRYLPDCEVGAAVVGQWSLSTPADARALAAFAAAFRGLVDGRTLVVVSTDFTHYGSDFGYVPFTDGVPERLPALDREMFEALAKNDNAVWAEALRRTGATVCGASSLHLLLAALPTKARFERIAYATSADVTGDWSHVVGYTAAAVFADWAQPLKKTAAAEYPGELSEAAGMALLDVARAGLRAAVVGGRSAAPDIPDGVREELQRRCGAFVTLKKNGMLRGCIGLIVSDRPVAAVVREMAAAAALDDPRFPPVNAGELASLDLEVSVLTEPETVAGPGEIVAGRDGVIISKHGRSAVFLPQVAAEQGWDVPTMLGQLCLKAGLGPGEWRSGAEFRTFRAQIFH